MISVGCNEYVQVVTVILSRHLVANFHFSPLSSPTRSAVLISVLTESEHAIGLQRMASGLVDRYRRSGKPRPLVVYTDRYCCTMEWLSKLNALFAGWDGLPVRFDVCHLMRRLAGGVTNESHPLYGIFMQHLSGCIFEWEAQDHRLLLSGKRSMMVAAGMMSQSEVAVRKAVTRDELARHCRRKTRGIDATVTAIENILVSFTGATDSLGVLLLKDEMTDIFHPGHLGKCDELPRVSTGRHHALERQTRAGRSGRRRHPAAHIRCASAIQPERTQSIAGHVVAVRAVPCADGIHRRSNWGGLSVTTDRHGVQGHHRCD